ncbi:hypothetical protein [Streptomyces malaysiense]|uniref:hypothetical protein n=1 Tax=Streptomyces malaysiense TaxID=1428626 RepID=UPI00142E4464|nr:hypothetical protein [Streptomyces malaysiense]
MTCAESKSLRIGPACAYFRTGSLAAGARFTPAGPSAVQTDRVTIDTLAGSLRTCTP